MVSWLHQAQEIQEELIAHRRWLHAHAETGFDLFMTKEYVKKALVNYGYLPTECGKNGLVALAGKGCGNKVLLLRADMDALPIREKSRCKFSCTTGAMHACGHDMHTAMLLGAAKLIKENENSLSGTVKLMFQAAEETLEGAKNMVSSGILESPKVDAAMMIHVMTGISIPTGTVIVAAPGVSAPAADYFTIRVLGKSCHGSAPQAGVDPINVACHILTSLQTIHARELSPFENAILTIGSIHAGTAANVIADSVTMLGTLRTEDEKNRDFIKNRLCEIAHHTAAAFRAEAEITFDSGCPTLLNDSALSQEISDYLKQLLGPQKALSAAQLKKEHTALAGGSEDFSYISHAVPSLMLALAAGEPKNGYTHPLHHPEAAFDESVLSTGSAVFAGTAFHWLSHQK